MQHHTPMMHHTGSPKQPTLHSLHGQMTGPYQAHEALYPPLNRQQPLVGQRAIRSMARPALKASQLQQLQVLPLPPRSVPTPPHPHLGI